MTDAESNLGLLSFRTCARARPQGTSLFHSRDYSMHSIYVVPHTTRHHINSMHRIVQSKYSVREKFPDGLQHESKKSED